MATAVAAFAESEKLVDQLIVEVRIREVVNVLDRLTPAPLTHSIFSLDHMLTLKLPLPAFEILIIFGPILGLLNGWFW